MKKVIAILGCMLLVAALAVTAFAAQIDMTLTADKTVIKAGDVVTFTISMPEMADCKSGGFSLDGLYDTEVFEFVGGDCPLDGTFLENVGYISNKLSGSFAYMEQTAVSGPIFNIQLKVKNDAPLGKTTVMPTVSVRNGSGNVAASINSLELDVVAIAMTLTADKTTATRGDVVTFTIAADEITDCKSGGFSLDGLYDTDVFEFVGGDCPLDGTMLENVGYISGKLSGSFLYSAAATVSGPVFTIRMKVKDTAAFGKTTVAPIVSVRNSAGAVSAAANALELEIVCTHDWGTGAVTTAATCTADGVCTYTCGSCGETRTEVIAMLGHKMDAGAVTKEPTCTAEGVKTYTCENGCGLTAVEVVAKLPHTEKTEVTREATCTEEGEKVTACAVCQTVISTEQLDKLPHTEKTEVTREATCTQAGLKTTTCTACQQVLRTEEIEKLGHTPVTTVTREPTYTADGEQITTCATCREVLSVETLDRLPGSLDGNEVVDEDDVIYLLQHVLMPQDFEVDQPVNYDNNDTVDEDDVIYLLQHLLMPEDFPLR